MSNDGLRTLFEVTIASSFGTFETVELLLQTAACLFLQPGPVSLSRAISSYCIPDLRLCVRLHPSTSLVPSHGIGFLSSVCSRSVPNALTTLMVVKANYRFDIPRPSFKHDRVSILAVLDKRHLFNILTNNQLVANLFAIKLSSISTLVDILRDNSLGVHS